MYAYISGTVAWIEDDAVIVRSNGLGLRIRVLPQLMNTLAEGREVELFLHHLVREESEVLVGFTSRDQERLFATLLEVSGVGPKVALALLGTHGAETLRRALVDGDETLLSRVSGVGRRLAARIVLELRDRIARDAAQAEGELQASRSAASADLIAALRSLGFPPREARELASLVEAAPSLRHAPLDERLRAALRERA